MKKIINKYIRFAAKHYIIVVLAAIAILAGSVYISSSLYIDSSMENIIPEDNKIIEAMQKIEDEFGNQESVLVVVIDNKISGEKNQISNDAIKILDNLYKSIKDADIANQILYKVQIGENASYLQSDDGSVALLNIYPEISMDDYINSREDFFSELDKIIKQAKDSAPDSFEIGMTGGTFVQDYESDSILYDSFLLSALATLVLVTLLFMLAFKRVILPFSTMLPLILGVMLTSAFAAIVYGGLNILSISFAVLLLGMGIDYAIHMLAGFEEHIQTTDSVADALVQTVEKTGVSMAMGSMTTSIAFVSFICAKIQAFGQMGIISAVGIFLAMLSQIAVTPALIAWANNRKVKRVESSLFKKIMSSYSRFTLRYRIPLSIILVLIMALLSFNVFRTEIVSNMDAIYPDDLDSIEWLAKVQDEIDYDPDEFTVMFDSYDEMVTGIDKLEDISEISSVQGIHSLLPSDRSMWQIALTMVPQEVKSNYISDSGKYIVKVTASGDIWDNAFMDEFRSKILNVSENVSGLPLMMNEISALVIKDGIRMTMIASILIFLVMLISFRNLKAAVFNIFIIVASIFILLGVMPILNINLTIINIVSIPLIIGIGVAGAIHLTRRMLRTNDPDMTLMHTGKGVVMSSVTTIVGFGSLILSGHPAILDLGKTVALGLFINLVLNLTFIPSLMSKSEKRVTE